MPETITRPAGRALHALREISLTRGAVPNAEGCCLVAFGNTRAAFLNVPRAAVRWVTPPQQYASSKFALRGFCANCGTPLSFEYLGSKRIDLSVGSLDEPQRVHPVSHFAVETRIAEWHAEDGLPGERLDEHQKLVDRWKQAYGDDVEPGIAATRKD